ncbi:MAG: lysophospholipid acyltransferase family protein [Acidobacteriota bacterium]
MSGPRGAPGTPSARFPPVLVNTTSQAQADSPGQVRWYDHGYHTPFFLRLVFSTIPRLPRFIHPPIAAVTAMIFFVVLRRERAALMRNLMRLGPHGRLWLRYKAFKIFYSYCDFMVSYCYVPRADDSSLLSMLADPERGAGTIDGCLAEGNGLIVWTAHIGNYEYGSRLLELHGRRVYEARVVETDNPAEITLRDLMANERLEIVALNDDPLASVRLLYALRANDIVAMQGDRTYNSSCAWVPFLGEPASFPLGPFFLAYFSGAPVLPCVVVRKGWLRYRVAMGDPIRLPHTGDRDADLRHGLVRAVAFLEKCCHQHHEQWFNFFDIWPAEGAGGKGTRGT